MTHRISITMIAMALLFLGVPFVQAGQESQINCDIQNRPCSETIAGITATLDISPRPVRAMEELIFQVTLSDSTHGVPTLIDLGMPGMKMGKNQVILKHMGGNLYGGKGIIVRCPSGKTVWKATVMIPGTGQAEYVFDVIY